MYFMLKETKTTLYFCHKPHFYCLDRAVYILSSEKRPRIFNDFFASIEPKVDNSEKRKLEICSCVLFIVLAI